MRVTLDMDAVYAREGTAPLQALELALAAAAASGQGGGGGEEASAEGVGALAAALKGVVWTRSMRRMYTLVDR
jgi:midasin